MRACEVRSLSVADDEHRNAYTKRGRDRELDSGTATVAGPLKYELECAHCGSAFTLDEGAVNRQVRCPICGGMLTVAVPIPIVPVAPPPAPPPPPPAFPPSPPPPRAPASHPRPIPGFGPPAPPPPPPVPTPAAPEPPPFFPPFVPAKPDLSDLAPESRARHLDAPWPTVRGGLNLARAAAYIALPLYVLFVVTDLLISQGMDARDTKLLKNALLVLALAQIVPLIVHTVAQITCTAVPLSHGAQQAATSAWLLGLAAIILLGLLLPDLAVYAAVGGAALMLISFGTWLGFLSRLGQRLADRALSSDAWSYSSWYWIGMLMSGLLLGGAELATPEPGERDAGGAKMLAWLLRAGSGIIGLLLLLGYTSLLRTASLAVARCAPVRYRP